MAQRLMSSKDKKKVRAWAIKEGREVLWCDDKGYWHAAKNRDTTPFGMAVETEDVRRATT